MINEEIKSSMITSFRSQIMNEYESEPLSLSLDFTDNKRAIGNIKVLKDGKLNEFKKQLSFTHNQLVRRLLLSKFIKMTTAKFDEYKKLNWAILHIDFKTNTIEVFSMCIDKHDREFSHNLKF